MIKFFQSRNIRQFKCLTDGLIADFGPAFKETVKMWCKRVDDGKFWEVWIVKKDKETIGICGLYSLDFDTKELWLGWLGILPQHRNNGIGKEVLEFLYSEAKKVKCKRINSYVDQEGKPLSFYYRNDFKRIGTVKEFLKKKRLTKMDAATFAENFEHLEDHVITKKI